MNTEQTSQNSTEARNDGNTVLAPVIFWQRFDQVKPQADSEYLVCNTDGIIKVSYFDGTHWGYLASVRENITHWSILPQVPVI